MFLWMVLIASIAFISDRYLRRIHMRSSVVLSCSSEVENPFLESVEEAVLEKRASENKDDEDMGIPDKSESSVNFNAYHRSVPFVKKSTNKELKKLFSNNRSFINGLMKPHDIYVLYDLGKRARSNANFKKGLIIGGVATIVACTAGEIGRAHV